MKRTITCSVNLLLNADVSGDEQAEMDVRLTDARFATIGYAQAGVNAAPMTQELKDALTNGVIKLGLQAMMDKLNGGHAEPAPIVTQPGADA